MKKWISLFLAVLVIFTACLPAFAATDVGGFAYPTVYIRGRVAYLYNHVGTEQESELYDIYDNKVFSPEVPDIKAYAIEQAKVLLPKFAKALLTQNYEPWASEFSCILAPIYRDFVLDQNGNPRNGSGAKTNWDALTDKADANGTYPIRNYDDLDELFYDFLWDWRCSPLDVADSLRAFIDRVLAVTGKKKVNLVSRCEGSCVAMAYLYKYGNDNKIANNVLLGSSANGVGYASGLFSGKFRLDADALNRYIGRNFATGSDKSFGDDLVADEVIRTYLRESLCLLAKSHSMDLLEKLLLRLINKVGPMVYPGLLMSSYGTCPGYWAMVRDEDYEDAKALAGLNDNPEWANFVKKIDEYHGQVQKRAGKILKTQQEKGVPSAVLVKYGAETMPIVTAANEISDGTTLVKDASFGAVTAKIDHPFDDAYVAAAVKAGKGDLISPDRMINASTCALPQSTWFIKYLSHDNWGSVLVDIFGEFIRSDGKLTVGQKGFERFEVFQPKTGTAVKMTEENANSQSDYYAKDLFGAFRRWLSALQALLKSLPKILFKR